MIVTILTQQLIGTEVRIKSRKDRLWPRSLLDSTYRVTLNTLNAELNPICHLLALLGAHHILLVSRIRVNQKSDA
jgi:hypothetical protein